MSSDGTEETIDSSELVDTAKIPGDGGELQLFKCDAEYSISIDGSHTLMSTWAHQSEDALAELACRKIAGRVQPRVLIGGLGMGFTLAAALRHLGAEAEVVVAELVPGVVAWNRGVLGKYAGHPLRDERATVREGDVAKLLRAQRQAYDAILLDVDNGPEGLTRKANDDIYGIDGLRAARAALRPGGVLAVWASGPNRQFANRLNDTGFIVDEVNVRANGKRGGARHVIWIATNDHAPRVSRSHAAHR